jgi:predicted phosphodiesterase
MTTYKTALPSLQDVISDIINVVKDNNIDVNDITVSKYRMCGGKFDGRALRRIGGFTAIIDEAFRGQRNVDINTVRYLQKRKSYVDSLERKLADGDYLQNAIYDGFKKALDTVGPFQITKINKHDKPKSISEERANVVVISDTHLGLNVSPEEVMANGYNWEVAARRLGKLAHQVAVFKLDHRDECPELHVCLGGDLGQGIIHLSESGTDLITYQVVGAALYFTQMIDHWRKYYKKIIVHCTPDNHMRLTHKGSDRALSQKFDSFATMVHLALQMGFRTVDDVEFDVPKTPITTFNVLDHKFGLTHGDTHITPGNVGKSVDVKGIAVQVMKLNASIKDGKHYDVVILGHVHVPLNMHLNETGTELVINGTASGTDGFSESVGFFRTKPFQVLFECTREHAVGDWRKIALDDADTKSTYESIIRPYSYGLEVKPILSLSPKNSIKFARRDND